MNKAIENIIKDFESGIMDAFSSGWEQKYRINSIIEALKKLDSEVIEIKYLKAMLKDMYHEVSTQFDISHWENDDDKVKRVAEKCQDIILEKLKRYTEPKMPAFIYRGILYDIICNVTHDDAIQGTYENIKFLQVLVNELYRLPARYPNNEIYQKHLALDTDRISTDDMLHAMEQYKTTDERILIINKITNDITVRTQQ